MAHKGECGEKGRRRAQRRARGEGRRGPEGGRISRVTTQRKEVVDGQKVTGLDPAGCRRKAGEERERTAARLRTRGPTKALSPKARHAAALRVQGLRAWHELGRDRALSWQVRINE